MGIENIISTQNTKKSYDEIKDKFKKATEDITAKKPIPSKEAVVGNLEEKNGRIMSEQLSQSFSADASGRSDLGDYEMKENQFMAELCFLKLVDAGELFDNETLYVAPGSDYDDKYNGTDALVTFYENEKDKLFVSLDIKATLTDASENYQKAVEIVRGKTRNGKLSIVKFNEFSEEAYGEEIEQKSTSGPGVVLWVDPSVITRLMDVLSTVNNERTAGDNNFLEKTTQNLYKEIEKFCVGRIKDAQESGEEKDGIEGVIAAYNQLKTICTKYIKAEKPKGKRRIIRK